MTPVEKLIDSACFVNPISCAMSGDLATFFEISAVIGIGIFIGWLLVGIARVPIRFFSAVFDLKVSPGKMLAVTLTLTFSGVAYALTEAFNQWVVLGLWVAWLLMWGALLHSKNAARRLSLLRDRPSYPFPETTTTTDAATSDDDDEWADIRAKLAAENSHQKGNR